MCFQVYLGSSQECPEIPYSERWDHIFVLKHPEHNGYSGKVSLQSTYLYHVGVMSCGCGLPYDFPVGQQDEWTQNNHRQLGDYLRECLQNAEPIELFSSWSGDEGRSVEKYRPVTVEGLLDPEFYFEERQITVVYKDKGSLHVAKDAVHSVD